MTISSANGTQKSRRANASPEAKRGPLSSENLTIVLARTRPKVCRTAAYRPAMVLHEWHRNGGLSTFRRAAGRDFRSQTSYSLYKQPRYLSMPDCVDVIIQDKI